MPADAETIKTNKFSRWSLWLYNGLLYLLLPFILLHFWRQGRRNKAYRARIQERFGKQPIASKHQGAVIFHCVSVGEFLAAKPLISAFLESANGTPVVVTCMTPTASELIQTTFGEQVYHCYLPLDTSAAMRRFIHGLQPKALVILETELWPNLMYQCQRAKVPTLLVNGRMSERSAAGYKRLDWLFAQTWGSLRYCGIQTESQASRFVAIGVEKDRVHTVGNLKFDLQIPDAQREQIQSYQNLLADRLIITAGSTHAGEEATILQAFKKVQQSYPNALLILVPRHQERFDEVADLLQEHEFSFVRRRTGQPILADTQVWLADTMGELMLWYGLARIAFVGGSLITRGGHNPLEPLVFGVPIVSGRHVFNFQDIYNELDRLQAVRWVQDSDSLASTLIGLMATPETARRLSQEAQQLFADHQGATRRYLATIHQVCEGRHG